MKTIRIILTLIVACFVFSGCTGAPVAFNAANQQLETANVDFSNGRNLSASASGFQLLLLIPININDRQERAFQILRGQAGDAYITDIKIKESWTWAFVGTVYKTTIEAKAYPYKHNL